MRRTLTMCVVIFSALALFACGNNDGASQNTPNPDTGVPAAVTTSSISGSVIKGPVDGAEMKLFYFAEDGAEIEIVAENAPVLTSPAGAYEFRLDPRQVEDIDSPLVMRSSGGTMGGQPAPRLETLIADPSALESSGVAVYRHLSTASSVAARMLAAQAAAAGLAPSSSEADECLVKVESALDVDLQQSPADITQAVAQLNQIVDENLDLFDSPENNEAVEEYIEYLARNLRSASGELDDRMEDPDHPGEDLEADFNRFGDRHLAKICPDGPARLRNLMMKVDKASILNDGVDAATIDLKLTNGWGRWFKSRNRIELAIVSGEGTLSDASLSYRRGRARATLTSTTAGEVVVQASYTLPNGNTLVQEVVVDVLDQQENAIPKADAGSDREVPTGSTVTLDGSRSSDPNNDSLSYSWTLATPAGSSAALSDATVFNPTFTVDVDGIYIAELVVNDGQQDSAPSTVTITAVSGNSAPMADAGADQNIATGTRVILDGSGSQDTDQDPLTYAWTLVSAPAGSNASISNPTQANPAFTADLDGTYVVQLVVNDGSADSAPARVTITASSANSAPTADAGPGQNVSTGSEVVLDGSGSRDADNDPLSYRWSMISRPAGSSAGLINESQPNAFFIADVAGTYVIELVVSDGSADSAPATVSVTAATANSAPMANAGRNQSVSAGTTVSLDGTGSRDADNDRLSYAWTLVSSPAGSRAALPAPATGAVILFAPDVAGAYVLQLVVNDGTVDSAPHSVTITATAVGPDGAALFSANCAGCHGADGTQIVNLRGMSASAIQSTLPHQGVTLTDIGGGAGAQAMADFLSR